MKECEGKQDPRSEGTLKMLSGKFSSLYEKMGQRLKDLVYKKNTEFVVEDENDEDESLASCTFPDFDPTKFDSDPSIIQETTERRLQKVFSSDSKSDEEPETRSPLTSNLKLSFDANSRQVSVNDANKVNLNPHNRKSKKDIRNRSSEFSKNELKMIDPTIVHRNSNDLWRYKNKGIHKDKGKFYNSGFALSAMSEKQKDGKFKPLT